MQTGLNLGRGEASMRRIVAAAAVLASLVLLTAPVVHAQGTGEIRKYSAGWNLIAAPPGTNFSAASTLYTAQPNDPGYEQVQAGDGTLEGFGYWAYVSAADASGYSRPVTLAQGDSAPYSINVPAGQWVLVGDPSGMLLASVHGSDVSYVF